MPMHNPPHPGELVKYECLEPLGLSVDRAAQGLGVTSQELSDLINEKSGISVGMAIRLSIAFGSTPEVWLGMQMDYDLWHAKERAESIKVERFVPPYPPWETDTSCESVSDAQPAASRHKAADGFQG